MTKLMDLLAKEGVIRKYSEDQPRDDNGRFSSGGGGGSGGGSKSPGQRNATRNASYAKQKAGEHEAKAKEHAKARDAALKRGDESSAVKHETARDLHSRTAGHYRSAESKFRAGNSTSAARSLASGESLSSASHDFSRWIGKK